MRREAIETWLNVLLGVLKTDNCANGASIGIDEELDDHPPRIFAEPCRIVCRRIAFQSVTGPLAWNTGLRPPPLHNLLI